MNFKRFDNESSWVIHPWNVMKHQTMICWWQIPIQDEVKGGLFSTSFVCLCQPFKKAFTLNYSEVFEQSRFQTYPVWSVSSIIFAGSKLWIALGRSSWPPDVFALARLTVKVEPAFSTAYQGVGQHNDPTSESVSTCAVATPKLTAYSTNQYQRSASISRTSNISVSLGRPLNDIMPSTTPKNTAKY